MGHGMIYNETKLEVTDQLWVLCWIMFLVSSINQIKK